MAIVPEASVVGLLLTMEVLTHLGVWVTVIDGDLIVAEDDGVLILTDGVKTHRLFLNDITRNHKVTIA